MSEYLSYSRTSSSGFVIPKKAKKEQKGGGLPPTIVPKELFQELMVNDQAFQQEVVPPFMDNLLISSLRAGVRLSNAKRVHNLKLDEKFLRRQTQLKRRGISADVSYTFLLMDAGDPTEEEYICKEGIFSGYTLFEELGPAEHGICLAIHPDCCTPASFFDRIRLRILIFKVLKGRSKTVQLKAGAESRADPSFNSHVPPPMQELHSETAQTRFRYSQIFLYEYNEKGAIVDLPSCVLPWATVTVSFNSPGLMTRYLLLPNERDALLWTGSLKFNEVIVESVDLLSPFKDGVKPSGFCSSMEVDSLHTWTSLLHYFPIAQLVSAPQLNGALVRRRVVEVRRKNGNKTCVSYFTLSQQSSPLFKRVHNTLRKAQLGGVSVLPDKSSVILLPNGELSSLLGLPSHEMPTFHCLFFSIETSDVMEYSLDSSNPTDLCTSPDPGERIEGGADGLISLLEKFNGIHNMKVASQQPSLLGLLPNMSTPPPPLPNMSTPPPPLPSQMVMASPAFPLPSLHHHTPHQPAPFYVHLPPPPPPVRQQTSFVSRDDNRHKNKSLIQQTLENVRNVGKKTKSPTDHRIILTPKTSCSYMPTVVAAASPVPERPQATEQSMPRDPRLKRMMVSDPRSHSTPVVNKVNTSQPPPPPSKPVSPLKKQQVEKVKVLPCLPTVINNISKPVVDNNDSLSRPYSPSQALPPLSPKGEVPMDIDEEESPEKPNGKAVEVVKDKKSSPALPRKEESIFNETNLSEAFSKKHLVTSTPKVPLKPIATQINDSSGFNFDFLNWSSSSKVKAQEERDDSPDHLCIADVEEEGPMSPALSPPIQTGFINKVLTIPLEPESSKEEGELDDTTLKTSKAKLEKQDESTPSPQSLDHEEDDQDFRDVWKTPQIRKSSNGECSQRPKLSDQQPVFVPKFSVPPPRLIENPIVNVNRMLTPATVAKPVRSVKPFGSEEPSPKTFPANLSLSQFPQFDRVPPSSPSSHPTSPYLMHRLDVPPPLISRPPPPTALTNPLVVVDPRLASLRLPIEPTREGKCREASQSPASMSNLSTGSRLTPSCSLMPELEQSIIVIPDPDLILNFAITPDELEELLVKSIQWKETCHQKRVSIKWHWCTTKALIAQRNNVKDAARSQKCNRFLDLIESYVDQGLIEYLKEHLCDLQAQPRNAHKYMICCMNAKRAAARNTRVIFLSVTIANGSSDEAKFTNNEIELCSPKKLVQELGKF